MRLSDLAKSMVLTILAVALICVLAAAIYYRSLGFLPFALGALIGSAVSIAKVFILEHGIDKALSMDQKRAASYLGLNHILRLLMSGAVLFLGAVVPHISLWGVAAGILAFQVATLNIKFASKG
ncbi:MAG: hypothetical protein GX855_02430 [Firmicutes bacterium]|jgi:hypothetical protein|nr:hypothetical protein [Bacillota bacterium]